MSLSNHFLTQELTQELYRQVKAFFDLPTEVKIRYEIPGLAGQRGYVSFGKEHAKGQSKGDLKEFFHFGQEPSLDANLEAPYPDNVLVSECPDFNTTGMEAYRMLEKTGIYVLRALALYMDLEETYFDHWVNNGNSILRPIHYPRLPRSLKGCSSGVWNINLITLLMGASAGLQVLIKKANGSMPSQRISWSLMSGTC